MRGRDFLDVAEDLLEGPREADWRSASSRAYYAAFHIARGLFVQCGFKVPEADWGHAYLWLRLSNAQHPDVQQAGYRLRQLRSSRNEADYDLDRSFSHRNAVDQVQEALEIIQLLELLAIDPVLRDGITGAIKTYERDVLKESTWHP